MGYWGGVVRLMVQEWHKGRWAGRNLLVPGLSIASWGYQTGRILFFVSLIGRAQNVILSVPLSVINKECRAYRGK